MPIKKRRQDSEKQQLILQRNSQLHGVLLAALLAVVLLVFGLVNLLHTKRDFSENENRKLQAYPQHLFNGVTVIYAPILL